MNKRISSLVLALALSISLGACTPKVDTKTTTPPKTTVATEPDTVPVTEGTKPEETVPMTEADSKGTKTDSKASDSTADSKNSNSSEGRFVIYSKDPNTNQKIEKARFNIDESLPLDKKLSTVADFLSSDVFDGAEIAVVEIVEEGGQKIAKVDLKGKDKWEKFFQGTTGGAMTQTSLIDSFLQRDYDGEWIDGVSFTLDGEEINSDHVPGLSETRFRVENKN